MYQSDFNAEREARERIAGEKADLLDQINKLRKPIGTDNITHHSFIVVHSGGS